MASPQPGGPIPPSPEAPTTNPLILCLTVKIDERIQQVLNLFFDNKSASCFMVGKQRNQTSAKISYKKGKSCQECFGTPIPALWPFLRKWGDSLTLLTLFSGHVPVLFHLP